MGNSPKFRNPFFIRLFHWEYWPFSVVYYPVFPIWILLCLRARAIYFFNASNPGIENGGMLNESKKDIHAMMPEDLYPRTKHYAADTAPEFVLNDMVTNCFAYPLYVKPDIGGRGRGVKKIQHPAELREYVLRCNLDFHVQEQVDYDQEVGIFYYRYPGESRGRITGVVQKEFLTVTGNGTDDIYTLLRKDIRGAVYAEQIKKSLKEDIGEIPAAGERKVVSPYGNHARGSRFVDAGFQADKQLHETVDQITSRIAGFYFGRLDIRFRNWEELKKGKDFKIIEVNGAGAEPTHMYDPAHSIFFAWKEIIRHWWIMTSVSIRNHQLGATYMTISEGRAMFRKHRELERKIEQITE